MSSEGEQINLNLGQCAKEIGRYICSNKTANKIVKYASKNKTGKYDKKIEKLSGKLEKQDIKLNEARELTTKLIESAKANGMTVKEVSTSRRFMTGSDIAFTILANATGVGGAWHTGQGTKYKLKKDKAEADKKEVSSKPQKVKETDFDAKNFADRASTKVKDKSDSSSSKKYVDNARGKDAEQKFESLSQDSTYRKMSERLEKAWDAHEFALEKSYSSSAEREAAVKKATEESDKAYQELIDYSREKIGFSYVDYNKARGH